MGESTKIHARYVVNLAVKMGRLPRPNALPCADCGHRWAPGERRHEYDHHRGYEPDHQLDVQAVCTTCHAARRHATPTCKHGHAWTPENTIRKCDGRRQCLECRRAFDRGRRDAAWWRNYRAKRRSA